jgi:hypothetical protein
MSLVLDNNGYFDECNNYTIYFMKECLSGSKKLEVFPVFSHLFLVYVQIKSSIFTCHFMMVFQSRTSSLLGEAILISKTSCRFQKKHIGSKSR